jgi:uncharacterized membrane protein (DUF4010 family)
VNALRLRDIAVANLSLSPTTLESSELSPLMSSISVLSTLQLDPFEELFVRSRETTAVHCWNRSLEIDRSTSGVLPLTSSFAFDCTQIGEAVTSAARAASTNERIDILFAGE